MKHQVSALINLSIELALGGGGWDFGDVIRNRCITDARIYIRGAKEQIIFMGYSFAAHPPPILLFLTGKRYIRDTVPV